MLCACKAEEVTKRPLAAIRSADVAPIRDQWLRDYNPATVLRRLAFFSRIQHSSQGMGH